MRRPDVVLIGEHDARAGDMLAAIHKGLADNDPPVARLSLVEAELAKIAVNTFVTLRLSYANMLAEACERLPGADVDRVTRAIGLDTRVGRRYLTGALSYGGPCFPRDNAALAAALGGMDLDGALPRAVDTANRQHSAHVAERVRALLPPGGTAGILGLSYKPGTGVVEESAALDLARRLADSGATVIIHDPQAMAAARSVLGERVRYAESMTACASAADVLVVAVPWPDYAALEPGHLRRPAGGLPVVVDAWRVLDPDRFAGACRLVAIGRAEP
jgi:UDPglucose 6-dehydrogenase